MHRQEALRPPTALDEIFFLRTGRQFGPRLEQLGAWGTFQPVLPFRTHPRAKVALRPRAIETDGVRVATAGYPAMSLCYHDARALVR